MDDPGRKRRQWTVTKEIPLTLLYSVAGLLVMIGMSYQLLKSDIAAQSKAQIELTTALKETNTALQALTKQFADGAVPSAQNAWRLQQLQSAQDDFKARIAEIERQGTSRELRLQRLETALTANNARARAREER